MTTIDNTPTVEIPESHWVDIRVDEDGTAPRLLASMRVTVAGQSTELHVTAICVNELDPDRPYFQEAMNAEDADDYDALYLLTGAHKPLNNIRIGGPGDNRPFVVFAEPFEW